LDSHDAVVIVNLTAKDKERLLWCTLAKLHVEDVSKATALIKEFVVHTGGGVNSGLEGLLQTYLDGDSELSEIRPLCLRILKQSNKGSQLWKKSYKALYDEAWAECAADPFLDHSRNCMVSPLAYSAMVAMKTRTTFSSG
jgi:hypothetical protein